jgi:hypothetical protein
MSYMYNVQNSVHMGEGGILDAHRFLKIFHSFGNNEL